MRASRRGVRGSVALLVVALFAAWGCERTPRDPDVILLVVDTLRAQNLSLYGYGRDTSPRLQEFAKDAVVYENAEPVWRYLGEARLTMHDISDAYLDDYVTRNWDSIRHSVGCYKVEEEGVRLFSAITGDHFTILGLPLLPLLAYLGNKGMIAR